MVHSTRWVCLDPASWSLERAVIAAVVVASRVPLPGKDGEPNRGSSSSDNLEVAVTMDVSDPIETIDSGRSLPVATELFSARLAEGEGDVLDPVNRWGVLPVAN